MAELPDIAVEVNGQKYKHWTGLSMSLGVNEFTPSFGLELFDELRTDARTGARWPIREQDEVRLFVDGALYITGQIEQFGVRYSGDSIRMGVQGQASTAFLVDSCPLTYTTSWDPGTTIGAVLRDLLTGSRVDVKDETAGGILNTQRLTERLGLRKVDDKIVDVLELLAIKYGLVMYPDPSGALTVTTTEDLARSESRDDGLPEKLISVGYDANYKKRAQIYSVVSVKPSNGRSSGKTSVIPSTVDVQDEHVPRPKRTVITTTQQFGNAELEQIGQYVLATQAGQSWAYVAELYGVRGPNGTPYYPGQILPFREPKLNADAQVMIDRMDVRITDMGLITTLLLRSPDTYGVSYDIPGERYPR